jgi:hypothetical protein
MKLFLPAILAIAMSVISHAEAPGFCSRPANQSCKSCIDDCVAARDQCKSKACVDSGGQDRGPIGCKDVQYKRAYAEGVKTCDVQKKACSDRCVARACSK